MKTLEVSERVLRSNRLKPTDCFHLLVLDGGESVAVVPVSSEAVAEIDYWSVWLVNKHLGGLEVPSRAF